MSGLSPAPLNNIEFSSTIIIFGESVTIHAGRTQDYQLSKPQASSEESLHSHVWSVCQFLVVPS